MELVRPFVLSGPEESIKSIEEASLAADIGEVRVHPFSVLTSTELAFVASMHLTSGVRLDGGVDLDVEERAEIDTAIRSFADLLTISRGRSIGVLSPTPAIGLTGDITSLLELSGSILRAPTVCVAHHVEDQLDISRLDWSILADRLDGVALLAEAISHRNDLGRYGQLLRILECGFGRGIGKFNRELRDFLSGIATRHHFTPREIAGWVESRPSVFHADRPSRQIWVQQDAALTVHRLQEAATDVLFNKTNWRSCDAARRVGRVPRRGTVDQAAGVFCTRGLDLKTSIAMFDHYGQFRLWMKKGMERHMPDGLWAMPIEDDVRLVFIGTPSDAPEGGVFEEIQGGSARFIRGSRLMAYDEDDDSVHELPETST